MIQGRFLKVLIFPRATLNKFASFTGKNKSLTNILNRKGHIIDTWGTLPGNLTGSFIGTAVTEKRPLVLRYVHC